MRRPATFQRFTMGLKAALCGTLLHCGAPEIDPGPLAGEPSFAAIPRQESPARAAALRQALHAANAPGLSEAGVGDGFYLAINKRALGERFFLSAFTRQYFPNAVAGGAARSLGTRVVKLMVSNDKLYVIEADDIKRSSDTFGPDGAILDAYPIIRDYSPFEVLPGSSRYVLIDPAAGLSRITLAQGGAFGSAPFHTELSYLQRFRRIADGITYEQVVTGYSVARLESGSQNDFRGVGTIGVALRRYHENPKFKVIVPAERMWPSYYFTSGPRIIKNEGRRDYPAARWDLSDPNRTIEWVVSPLVPAKYQQAFIDGIEGWNAAFGRKVLSARIGRPEESFADDDKNYLIFDGDPSYGAAYANWRVNPNTGEIRGATVYMNASWTDGADEIEANPLPGLRTRTPRESAGKPAPVLIWEGVTEAPLCELSQDEVMRALMDGPDHPELAGLTPEEQAQRYVEHTVSHEIGHTLGLRHNFAGSLKTSMTTPGGSSVMDYLGAVDSILLPKPGTYDRAAIELLYEKTESRPGDPFCTDGGNALYPDCQLFDSTADPLSQYWTPRFNTNIGLVFANMPAPLLSSRLNGVLMYLRAGAAAQRLSAWNTVIAPISVTRVPPMPLPARYRENVNALARYILMRMWLDPATSRGSISADPPLDAAWIARYLPELRGNLLSSDGLRGYEVRRVVVDILKKWQRVEGQALLREARAALQAELPGLVGDALNLHNDLISRIDAALSPYFVK